MKFAAVELVVAAVALAVGAMFACGFATGMAVFMIMDGSTRR